MRIVVSGGAGFIGRSLCAALCQEGHRVTLLTRRKAEAQRSYGSTGCPWNRGKVSALPLDERHASCGCASFFMNERRACWSKEESSGGCGVR